jgi:quinol monooxygenase YgiN
MMERREFITLSTAAMFGHLPFWPNEAAAPSWSYEPRPCGPHGIGANDDMYGLIGKIVAVEGRRAELADILLEGIGGMPGCLSYVVANDATDENALWVTEVWDAQASHEASLELPTVQEAIQRGRPLIAGFGERFVTTPLGGHGLAVE